MSKIPALSFLHLTVIVPSLVGVLNVFIILGRCGVSWSDDHVSLDCSECGGYSLSRPCPMCDGKCKSQWQRDVSTVSNDKNV